MVITSIKSKILLLLLAITAVVVIGMAVMMQLGFQQGFTAYKKSLAEQLNKRMVNALERHYAEQQSWQLFSDDPRAWHELIFRSATERRQDARGGDHKQNTRSKNAGPPPRERPHDRPQGRQQDHPPVQSKADRARLRHSELSQVLPSYSLFDQQKQLVIGATQWDDPDIRQVALKYRGQVVGHMGHLAQPDNERQQDHQFYATFVKLLVMIAAVMILVALLFTVPVARYFTRPIGVLNQAMKQAAAGDFTSQTDIQRHDELGQLGQNFNVLTSTLASNADVQKKMMADIAHELRTPVAVIQAQIEALQDGIHQADAKSLGLLHDQVLALGRLIGDLHQLSVAELGNMQYQMQAVDVLEVLGKVIDAQQLALQEKNLSFTTRSWPKRPLLVLGDPTRLQQLFMNLLDNSIAYTDAGGCVELAVAEVGDEVEVVLSDSAPGLLPHDQAQMFDRLYRQETSRNKNSGGSGLGLAIVKRIVEAHGGSITASDSSLGGVRMSVRIPSHV